ncbi:MAG: phosphoenolpyruvate--protein phosphotransferase [Candidatus Omnitrophota bacterium]
MNEIILKGIPAAPGIAFGPAFMLGKEEIAIARRVITEAEIPAEIAKLEEALIQTRREIKELQNKISADMGTDHAEIFDAHLLVLEDRMLIEEVITGIKKERVCVEYIFSEVLKKYVRVFAAVEDEYLRERISDINDVGKRVLKNFTGRKKSLGFEALEEKMVVVAHDISPSDTASMHKKNVIAFATDIGGRTSHSAIMAKSLEIPAVVGLEEATAKINNRDFLIIDGINGVVVVNPSRETLDRYKKEHRKFAQSKEKFIQIKDLPAQTRDGRKVQLAANLELPEEIPSVLNYNVNGIGLYRTEYFYMNRVDLPSEEEHYAAYRHVAEAIKPNPVIIRTLDLGGDKFLSSLEIPHDMHPFLGWRAIRFCLARPDIFKVQLRAILRASVWGKLRLMYPMISGIEELRQANKILDEVKAELRKERKPFDEDIEVGAMIEVPSAALTADLLAKEAHFFSIGTNDLIQYAIAADRSNEKIAYLYEPAHPGVLRLIKIIIESGHNNGIWVGMCGEMAGEPALALLLLGLGLDEFSMPPIAIPKIKQLIREVSFKDAQEIADTALGLATGKEVEEFAAQKLKELAPDLSP